MKIKQSDTWTHHVLEDVTWESLKIHLQLLVLLVAPNLKEKTLFTGLIRHVRQNRSRKTLKVLTQERRPSACWVITLTKFSIVFSSQDAEPWSSSNRAAVSFRTWTVNATLSSAWRRRRRIRFSRYIRSQIDHHFLSAGSRRTYRRFGRQVVELVGEGHDVSPPGAVRGVISLNGKQRDNEVKAFQRRLSDVIGRRRELTMASRRSSEVSLYCLNLCSIHLQLREESAL